MHDGIELRCLYVKVFVGVLRFRIVFLFNARCCDERHVVCSISKITKNRGEGKNEAVRKVIREFQ